MKEIQYRKLVEKRKRCTRCENLDPPLINPSNVNNGVYDSDEIGPWSLWQGSLNAKILLVGQDWGTEDHFIQRRGRDTSRNTTNKNLMKLFKSIGYPIKAPEENDFGNADLFFTNLVLCLKRGNLQSRIDPRAGDCCAKLFLKPLIEIIQPKVVITLGNIAYESIAEVYGLDPNRFSETVVERPEGFLLREGTVMFPVYHCGARSVNMNRSFEEQKNDWRKIKNYLEREGRK